MEGSVIEFLAVRLSSDKDAQIEWGIWSSHNHQVTNTGTIDGWNELSDLIEQFSQFPIWLILASEELILTQVDIPDGVARKLDGTLPYLLEDDLAQDVDDLHIALLETVDKVAYVCGVERSFLSEALATFKELGSEVRKVVPDVLTLPLDAPLTALKVRDQWLIRKGERTGVSLNEQWFEFMLTSDWAKEEGKTLDCLSYSELPPSIEANHPDWEVKKNKEPMALMTQGAHDSKFNLLTGDFQVRASWFRYIRVWKQGVITAVALTLIVMINTIVQTHNENAEAKAYRAESERIFRLMMPGKTKIPTVNYLKKQFNEEIKSLSGGSSSGSLLVMLETVGNSLKNNGLALESLSFDRPRDELKVQATAADFSNFEKNRIVLSEKLKVDQGQLTKADGKVSGTFVITLK